MQRSLVHPVLADESAERIDVTRAQGGRHLARERLDAGERGDGVRLAGDVRIAHGGDRAARQARLAGEQQHAPANEVVRARAWQMEQLDARAVGEAEQKRAAVRRGVVVLIASRDAQVLDLGSATERSELVRGEGSAAKHGQRPGQRDAACR
jgi:hypothetical protein